MPQSTLLHGSNDMLDAVEVANQIPSSFYTQMESKKWSDRKEALDIIERVTNVPKIQNSDFSELVRVLKKTIAKDANIVVVTAAAKCLCQLAVGLRANFSPYASSTLTILLEKFKEKKPSVVSLLRDATDAVFVGTNLENVHEDIITFLDNKNPQIKAEVALFLSRVFSHYPQQVRNKKILKPMVNALVKTLSDMDSVVRDNSAMAIGTGMKVIGENLMMPLIGDIEAIKITKIKECYDKAEIFVPPVNGQSEPVMRELNGQQEIQPQLNGGAADEAEDDEQSVYDMLDAADVANQIPASFYTQMESKKWSDRKEALDIIERVTNVPKIQNSDFSELVRVLKKTIAKDANIVVVTAAVKCLCQLAVGLRTNFSPYADSTLTILLEKFKEKKPNVVSLLRDATDAVFVGTNLENVHEDIITFLDNKNPQIKAEVALFLSRVFSQFPIQVRNKKVLKPMVNALVKTLSDMDSTVRDNSAMAIGTAMKVIGEPLMMPLIGDIEAIKIPKIKEFCEKAQVKKIPQSVLNAMNANAAAQQAPPPPSRNSATMVRSTSNRRLTTGGIGRGAGHKTAPAPVAASTTAPPPQAPSSNATVKRNATIIKRSTVPKRSLAPPSSSSHQQANNVQPPPATNNSNNMGPPTTMPPSSQANMARTMAAPQPPSAMGVTSTPVKPVYPTTVRQTNKIHKPPQQQLQQQGNLDMTIFRLISDDQNEVLDSLLELDEILTDDSEHEFKSRMNQMIDLLCLQLIKSMDGFRTNPADDLQSHKIQKISDLLKKLFARRQLVAATSQQSTRFLLVQLFTLAQSCAIIETLPDHDDGFVRKNLNNLVLAIMDSFEPTNIMCILSGLLNEPTSVSIVEPVKDAIIRSMRAFK